MTNDKGQEIRITPDVLMDDFITEEKFNEIKRQSELAEEQKTKEKLAKEQRDKETKRKYKQECIHRFGSKYGMLVFEERVQIGMTKEMCEMAWGFPVDINTTMVKGMTHEQWVYSMKTYLYFDNGVLTTTQF
jgi:hypothetical protein